MLDSIAGLPVHPLVVHAVVVLGPLAALMLLAYSLVPRWRVGLRWPTIVLVAVAATSGWIAEESGEALEVALAQAGRLPGEAVETHSEAGELAALSLYLLLGVAAVVIFVLLPARREPAGAGVRRLVGGVAALAAAGFVLVAVLLAGHSGATAVWDGIMG